MQKKMMIADVMQAKIRIRPFIRTTPLIRMEKLEQLFDGAEIWFKLESFQYTGSFKVRGAANKMLSLSPEQLAYGVTAASSGNHAQAVSYMAAKLGTRAKIVMPLNAPTVKVKGAQDNGAEIVLYGLTGEDRDKKCQELIQEENLCLVHSHMDPDVIIGHGTVGLEAWEQMNGEMDEIIVPCGAGSLTSGLAFAMKQIAPCVKVTAVEPAAVPRFTESLNAGKASTVHMGETIADGLRVSKAEEINFSLIRDYVDSLITVEEAVLRRAVKEVALRGRITAEPSACIGVAAALDGKIDTSRGRKLCFVITGGNVDAALYSELLSC